MRLNRWVLRRQVKRALVALGSRRSLDGRPRVVVLCYHSVHPSNPIATLHPEMFEAHLEWLTATCDVIPFSEVASRLRVPRGPRPAVCITFDDGYADNHEWAYPLLSKRGLPATFFVTAGLIDRDRGVLNRFRGFYGVAPEDVEPMGWAELREMAENGMEIGGHTYSHPNLARLEPHELRDELTRSKALIEEEMGRPVTVMAYPFGLPRAHVNRRVVAAVRAAGYEAAAAVLYRDVRPNDVPFVIPRFFVKRDDPEVIGLKVLGGFDVVSIWQRRAPLSLGRLLSPDYFGSGDWVRGPA